MIADFMINETDNLDPEGLDMLKLSKENTYISINPYLTEEDAELLRNYSLRMLPIRYELYIKEKEAKGLKKRLTDS